MNKRKKTNIPPKEIRLNKYLAHAGVASRRKADELIEQGLVKVNGHVVREVGAKVNTTDTIEYRGKRVKPEQKIYVLLNKPRDVITTTSDDRDRKTVMHLIQSGLKKKLAQSTVPRLYPVGRLDRQTTGLLLITNDGDLSKSLMHPSKKVPKIYQVELNKPLSKHHFEAILKGVELEDGVVPVDELAYPDAKNKKMVGIELHVGRNRIIRRLFEQLDYRVVRLDRVVYAGLTKKDLPRGKWRILSKPEVIRLKHFL